MAMEALDFIFQQQQLQDHSFFTQFNNKLDDPLLLSCWTTLEFDHDDPNFLVENRSESSCFHLLDDGTGNHHYNWDSYFPPISSSSTPNAARSPDGSGNYIGMSSDPINADSNTNSPSSSSPAAVAQRAKRQRRKSGKNNEEIENQRRTHIAVERNRRKQMNDYLSVLRSLMPDSFVQRSDQASIIGGAINFVKELEQKLQQLGRRRPNRTEQESDIGSLPFSEFFTFPQYSSSTTNLEANNHPMGPARRGIGDVEVTMVESHASVRIRWEKKPKQLMRIVAGMQSLRLTILHLNVTTANDRQIALYSLSLKVEDDCRLNSVDEIATAVYEMMVGRISQEACA